MTCIKMGSDESHFRSDGQSHKTESANHNLFEEKESRSGIEPRSFRLPANALPLGQTGSLKRERELELENFILQGL